MFAKRKSKLLVLVLTEREVEGVAVVCAEIAGTSQERTFFIKCVSTLFLSRSLYSSVVERGEGACHPEPRHPPRDVWCPYRQHTRTERQIRPNAMDSERNQASGKKERKGDTHTEATRREEGEMCHLVSVHH